jgi:hypothetical protein
MIRRGAAPVARYRCIDTDGANIAIRVPKKLFRRINRFDDGRAGPAGQNSPPTAISAGPPRRYLVNAKMV